MKVGDNYPNWLWKQKDKKKQKEKEKYTPKRRIKKEKNPGT